MNINKKLEKYIALNENFRYFKLYWALDKASFENVTRQKYYEENLTIITNSLNFINNNSPYNALNSRHRVTQKFVLGERKGLKEFLNRCFGGRVLIEHAIQRNLYINKDKYLVELGEIIGYEVDLPFERSLAKVDLMSYKDGYLYLIELKRCKIGGSTQDSQEQLIRAIMEIETYNSYMDDETIRNLQQVTELKDKKILGIKKMILSSRNIFNDYYFFDDDLKKYIDKNIEFKCISCENDILDLKIGTLEKLFTIQEVN